VASKSFSSTKGGPSPEGRSRDKGSPGQGKTQKAIQGKGFLSQGVFDRGGSVLCDVRGVEKSAAHHLRRSSGSGAKREERSMSKRKERKKRGVPARGRTILVSAG